MLFYFILNFHALRKKVSVFGVILVCIFPHSDHNNTKYEHFSRSDGEMASLKYSWNSHLVFCGCGKTFRNNSSLEHLWRVVSEWSKESRMKFAYVLALLNGYFRWRFKSHFWGLLYLNIIISILEIY